VIIEFNDKERIWDIEAITNFFLLVHPNVFNWDSYIATAIMEDSTGDMDYDHISEVPSGWPQERMNLSGIILGMTDSDRKYEFQVLAGENLSIMPITLDELRSEEPVIYGKFLEHGYYSIDKVEMMVRKSKTFSAAPVVPITLGRDQENIGNLRLTIIQTLDAAVKRDTEKRQNLSRENFPKSNWGYLASVALNQKFAVHRLTVSTDGLESSVTCSFQDYETDEILTVKMNFRREQTFMQNPWRITGFLKMPPKPRPSVLQQSLR